MSTNPKFCLPYSISCSKFNQYARASACMGERGWEEGGEGVGGEGVGGEGVGERGWGRGVGGGEGWGWGDDDVLLFTH